ncbi:MAG TPA: ParB/RepB/Spo0J family partition protein [Planctomycetota bacterium]|nr:ParB/RepB/Spo0J family partition protein [Planctomycetota bacterium]HRR80941.1 ParB/RepB/Spo0J family partition protein [Planctomycetota bacterium]HRT93760.1 ParB/RepB/Spo0J family partition protein [Planctomycetota bacterium]
MKSSHLGRGLGALLGNAEELQPEPQQTLEIPVAKVRPNPNQPRHEFDQDSLGELVESVTRNGVIQPIIVRALEDGYELIAGERRWRAAQLAGLATIPAIVRPASENESLELALIENIQRQDLNPMEQARAYKNLIERFSLTQEEAAARLGKKRSSVANILRLLDLPTDIQDAVSRGTLSMGHARALLALPDRAEQVRLAARIQRDDLSVRQTEQIVNDRLKRARSHQSTTEPKPAYITDLEGKLREALATRVTILPHKHDEGGRIVVDFFTKDDFQRLLERLLPRAGRPEEATAT